jgi:hypothetical protein
MGMGISLAVMRKNLHTNPNFFAGEEKSARLNFPSQKFDAEYELYSIFIANEKSDLNLK